MIALTILVVLVVYLLIAVLVTWAIAKRQKSGKAKWLAGFFSVAVFVLIPTWDWVLGSIYFKYLCEVDAGFKVYQTVKLGREFFDEKGAAKFIEPKGDINWKMLGGRYGRKIDEQPVSPEFLNIKEFLWIVEDKQTQTKLAVLVSPNQGRNWVGRLSGLSGGASGYCSDQDFKSEYLAMIRKVFIADSSRD